ncbi:MAG TPA: hypothetical protein DD397_07985 [Hyphomonas sp.]|nr:hypothetical protein [Hyphomonas sp.]MAX82687.1 hypothetical protein [Hyphomonas sp.]HAQ78070.1 hypothetical protein [Hyphomonas sp.]HBN92486.1 hypothetical protein [Hyphomonas sp.]HBT36204.1 hypothetical protein [Hyphomonas sp.]
MPGRRAEATELSRIRRQFVHDQCRVLAAFHRQDRIVAFQRVALAAPAQHPVEFLDHDLAQAQTRPVISREIGIDPAHGDKPLIEVIDKCVDAFSALS